MTLNHTVTAFGADGHTGRFVVSELRQGGWTSILSGRDPDKLNAIELAGTAGVFTAGEAFDAGDFLRSLCPAHLSLEIQ